MQIHCCDSAIFVVVIFIIIPVIIVSFFKATLK